MIERIAKETTMDSTGAYQDSGQAELKKRIARYKAAGASNPGPWDCAKRQVADRGIRTDAVPDRRQVRPPQLAAENCSPPVNLGMACTDRLVPGDCTVRI